MSRPRLHQFIVNKLRRKPNKRLETLPVATGHTPTVTLPQLEPRISNAATPSRKGKKGRGRGHTGRSINRRQHHGHGKSHRFYPQHQKAKAGRKANRRRLIAAKR